MQWDVSVGQATLLTFLVGLAVGTLATVLALLVSLGAFWFRIAGWRLAVGLVSSFLLVPVYVQATAWSAGFGSNGWLRLSQVDAAKSPWMGVASVVWIHACAALPYCFWIVSLGPSFALRRQILPRLGPWLLGALLWAFACVQYDMVVSNLFQTPTLCESVYQQVQFGKLRSVPILIAWAISILCGLALALSVFFSMWQGATQAGRSAVDSVGSYRFDAAIARPWYAWLTLSVWGVLTVCCMVPWMNLISRMGWSSVLVEGRGVRSWSLSEVVAAFGHVADFRAEFGWSLQLSLWTVGLSLFLTASMIPWSGTRYRAACLFGILGCMLATPGPLINLLIGQILNRWLSDSWSFLADQTLLGPILALQFRVLPVVFGLIWVAQQQYLHRYGELLALEAGLSYRMRFYVWMRFVQRGWIIA
ncbi:MAG: hypothetical protein LW720_20755, partial [Pirellula sp.]|nr:hypothetical protein [Pirellula sp.]